MWKQIGCASLAMSAMFLVLPRAGANKNFVADWTFQGSSLGPARIIGNADWRAENGEIIGTPKIAEGGWLILDKPFQDVQFASTFRCTGGCRAGVMMRTQSTPQGIQGVYVALPEGENPAAAFALKLDPQGREIGREPLNRDLAPSASSRRHPTPDEALLRRAVPAAVPAPYQARDAAGQAEASGPAVCPRTRPIPVRSIPTGPTSGIRSRSSLTLTTCARGSMMDRKQAARTARPTRMSRSTALWRYMSAARAKCASNKWN